MLRNIGRVRGIDIIECTGWDAIRGIIGREVMLETHHFVFRNCPMIHSFLVKMPFYAIFIESNGRIVRKELVRPNTFSGLYQLSTLCLEAKNELADDLIREIFALVSKA